MHQAKIAVVVGDWGLIDLNYITFPRVRGITKFVVDFQDLYFLDMIQKDLTATTGRNDHKFSATKLYVLMRVSQWRMKIQTESYSDYIFIV